MDKPTSPDRLAILATSTAVPLLPPGALAGQRIGISIGDSEDLPRLGLTALHQQLALRELARTVLLGRGSLAYGGHIKPEGFTAFLMGELTQYASSGVIGRGIQGRPLLVCLAWTVHRRNTLDELARARRLLGLYGELRCLDLQGAPLADPTQGRSEAGEAGFDAATAARSMTSLREHLIQHTSARMVIGGKRQGYSGRWPGVVEEALMALQAQQPVYLAAGLGGATLDLAATLDTRCAALCPGQAPAVLPGLDELRALAAGRGFDALANGLDADENLRLAMTHRPAEIAALVALGLGRLQQSAGGASRP